MGVKHPICLSKNHILQPFISDHLTSAVSLVPQVRISINPCSSLLVRAHSFRTEGILYKFVKLTNLWEYLAIGTAIFIRELRQRREKLKIFHMGLFST
jgi:hypothetical protein